MSDLKTNLEAILQEKQDKIIPANIKKDVQIFDITGIYEGLDTSDADAIPLDIVAPRTAYVNGQKITGTLQGVDEFAPIGIAGDADNITLETIDETINVVAAEYTKTSEPTLLNGNCKIIAFMKQSSVATVAGLTPEKIVSGNTILGVEGTATTGIDTSDANAIADDIIAGKTAYVNGEKITGNIVKNDPISPSGEISMSEFTLGEDDMIGFTGELGGVIRQYADTDTDIHISVKQSDLANYIGLTPDKIKIGETILGVTGTYIGEASL